MTETKVVKSKQLLIKPKPYINQLEQIVNALDRIAEELAIINEYYRANEEEPY